MKEKTTQIKGEGTVEDLGDMQIVHKGYTLEIDTESNQIKIVLDEDDIRHLKSVIERLESGEFERNAE